MEVPRSCEEEEGAEVPEGLEARVGNDASAGIESISTSGDVSTGAAFLLSTSSLVYSASIRRIPKACRLRMEEKRLVLGWHHGATDKAKPEWGSNTQFSLLNGDSCLDPPRGGIQNQRCQPAL
ncbi:hypothetical protein H5410_005649 [Solanum commersonii]|uniref:Uncharacterized protein n=1 Tax=Solanum commersonii TaxID=4109 RepID=A0A9J6A8W4_SOLCO|nr:hypothetical protein H5410_005649 [Solanum commersonii]